MGVRCVLVMPDGRIGGWYSVGNEEYGACYDWAISSGLEYDTVIPISEADGSQSSGSGSPPLPSAEDAATAWGIGFVLVVGCYVIARSVGAVVNFIDSN